MIDDVFMKLAIEEAKKCPPSQTAYSVGCVIVRDGKVVSTGYSREDGDKVHAEESALSKLEGIANGCTVYTTMEPCSTRASRPTPCAQLIIRSGATTVVYACEEPPHFVADCKGVELLKKQGIEVYHLGKYHPEYEQQCLALNGHIQTSK